MTDTASPPVAITAAAYADRLRRAQAAAAEQGVAALLVGVGPELQWLTGYAARGMERLTLLILPAVGRPTLVVPRLEEPAARVAAGIEAGLADVATWGETDDPVAHVRDALSDGRAAGAGRLGVSDGLRSAFLLRLQAGLTGGSFEVASPLMSPLRAIKDAQEMELLRIAAHAADRTVIGIANGRLVGRTEADIAREVRERLVAEGHDEPAFWIVASGPNAASPHHEAGARIVQPGEPIVIDIGGHVSGYHSDITRTVWVTGGNTDRGPDDTFAEIYRVVRSAQEAARAAVRPGAPAERLDRAARQVIDAAGYGDRFLHRLGHGIGLEVHEDPYLVEGNASHLRQGNVFSVEPGIYLEGRYGVRIEDIVACGPDGPDELNCASRDLLVVNGT